MTGLFCLPRLPTYLRRTPASSNQYLSNGCPTVAHFRTSRSFSRDSNGKALEVVVFLPLNWHRGPWNWHKTIQTSRACSIKLAKVTQPPPGTNLSSIILSQRHWQVTKTRTTLGSEPFRRFSISSPEPSFLLIRQHWGGGQMIVFLTYPLDPSPRRPIAWWIFLRPILQSCPNQICILRTNHNPSSPNRLKYINTTGSEDIFIHRTHSMFIP